MNNSMIDYLFLDYLIVLAQRYSSTVAEAFKNIKPNNPMCDELYKILGEPFDENIWNHLKENTCLFKLTWKQTYPKEKNGEKTFYGMLLEGMLK